MYIDAHKYVALRTPGIFISWIRVYKFIYLLIQTDDVFETKPQPLSVHEGKKGSVTYRISNETLSVAPGFAYPKAGATNHLNFPVKLLFYIDRQTYVRSSLK